MTACGIARRHGAILRFGDQPQLDLVRPTLDEPPGRIAIETSRSLSHATWLAGAPRGPSGAYRHARRAPAHPPVVA